MPNNTETGISPSPLSLLKDATRADPRLKVLFGVIAVVATGSLCLSLSGMDVQATRNLFLSTVAGAFIVMVLLWVAEAAKNPRHKFHRELYAPFRLLMWCATVALVGLMLAQTFVLIRGILASTSADEPTAGPDPIPVVDFSDPSKTKPQALGNVLVVRNDLDDTFILNVVYYTYGVGGPAKWIGKSVRLYPHSRQDVLSRTAGIVYLQVSLTSRLGYLSFTPPRRAVIGMGKAKTESVKWNGAVLDSLNLGTADELAQSPLEIVLDKTTLAP